MKDIILKEEFIQSTKDYLLKVLDEIEEYENDDWKEVVKEMCNNLGVDFDSNEINEDLVYEFKERILY